jgi:O-antigen/teichoic acid export membrane protein
VRVLRAVGSLARRLGPSAALFLSGVGALYIADLIISRHDDPNLVASWMSLKAFMMIASTAAVFGMDQLIVREPGAARLLVRAVVVNVVLVAVVAALLGLYLGLVPSWYVGAAVVAGFALSNVSFHFLRSNLRLAEAYVAHGTWRVLFLAGVVLFLGSVVSDAGLILVGAFILGGGVIAAVLLRPAKAAKLTSPHDDIKTVWDAYKIGGTYFLAAISLAIASYGENLVIRQIGTAEEAARYFQALVLFLLPGVMANQYLSAIIGPYIREQEARVLGLLRRYAVLAGLSILILLWPMLVVGGYVLEWLVHGQIRTPLVLAALLSLTSCIRLVYILPSSFVGMLADRKELLRASLAFLGCALLLPVLSVLFHAAGVTAMIAVAVASLVNWTLRCLVGAGLVLRRLKKNSGAAASSD